MDSTEQMKRIVYLFGSGAVQAELQHKQVESDVVMTGLNKGVYDLSRSNARPISDTPARTT